MLIPDVRLASVQYKKLDYKYRKIPFRIRKLAMVLIKNGIIIPFFLTSDKNGTIIPFIDRKNSREYHPVHGYKNYAS